MNLLFAWRYFSYKKSTQAINIIAWVSVVAIAVVTAALIIVLSVYNGFEGLVKSLYTDFYSDIKITSAQGKTFIIDSSNYKALQNISGIKKISAVVEEKAVLINKDYQTIVYLRGVDENYNSVCNLSKYIIRGKQQLGTTASPKIILGAGIENAIAADVEMPLAPLTVYMPNKNKSSAGIANADTWNAFNIIPTATFIVQQEFDNKYAFTNLDFIQYMLDLKPNEFSSIEVKTTAVIEPGKIKKNIEEVLGKNYFVQTRYEQNQSLYRILTTEKWVIYGILALILSVAAFNIIGALTMLILEKQKDVDVLKAMGASTQKVQNIFLTEGLLLSAIGGASGIIIATIICWLQLKFKFIKLTGGSFIIDYYPVKMLWMDYVLVVITVIIIAVLASYFPARKAAQKAISLRA